MSTPTRLRPTLRQAVRIGATVMLASCGAPRSEAPVGPALQLPPIPARTGARPDVILVSVDSLRADHLGAWGYPLATSPNLDALAARGLRFSHARAHNSWTLPSHATLLTGLDPFEHGVDLDIWRLAEEPPRLAERMRAAGYWTVGRASGFYVTSRFGFDRGFERWSDNGLTGTVVDRPARGLDEYLRGAVVDAAEAAPDQPVFLFLHIFWVHYPYDPPEPWSAWRDPPATPAQLAYQGHLFYANRAPDAETLALQSAQYDESIRWVDDRLGALIRAWDAARPGAVWAIVADHGEELGEHGSWGHQTTLHPEVLDVPLILAGPGIPVGVRDDAVTLRDVAPTLAALAGADPIGSGLDLSQGPVPSRLEFASVAQGAPPVVSVSRDDLRYELNPKTGRERLFDRRHDPQELHARTMTDARADLELRDAVRAHLSRGWGAPAGTTLTSPTLIWTPKGPVHRWIVDGPFGIWPYRRQLSVGGGAPCELEQHPAGCPPLLATARAPLAPVTLIAEERARLEALGYLAPSDEVPSPAP